MEKQVAVTIAAGLVPAVFVFGLAVWRMRRLVAGLREAIIDSGEAIVIEPQRGVYLRRAWIGAVHTDGVIALTDRRLVFRKPIGGDISLSLSEMAYISRTRWYRGNYHGGRDFLVVEMNNGSEVAFNVRDPDLWIQKLLEWEDQQNK